MKRIKYDSEDISNEALEDRDNSSWSRILSDYQGWCEKLPMDVLYANDSLAAVIWQLENNLKMKIKFEPEY